MSKNQTSMRIKMARLAKGLTQAEVADRMGTHASQYGTIENKGSCTLATAARIAEVLGVSLDYLAGLTDGDEETQRRAEILTQIESLKAQL